MKLLRRIGLTLGLTFFLALGQLGGLLHGLAHASERISQKQDAPLTAPACDQCAAFAQLTGVASAGVPPVAMAAGFVAALAIDERGLAARAPIVFLSRAPPVLL